MIGDLSFKVFRISLISLLVSLLKGLFCELSHENYVLLINLGRWHRLDFFEEGVNDRQCKVGQNFLDQVIHCAHHFFMLSLLTFPYKLHDRFVEEVVAEPWKHFEDGP